MEECLPGVCETLCLMPSSEKGGVTRAPHPGHRLEGKEIDLHIQGMCFFFF